MLITAALFFATLFVACANGANDNFKLMWMRHGHFLPRYDA